MPLVELHYLPLDEDGFDLDIEDAITLLDASERRRYERFRNEHSKSCFLQARRIAKTELAKKCYCLPEEVRFSYTDTDKPYLSDNTQWHFNISHSQSSIIVAISDYPVGVDVEDLDRCAKIWNKAEDFLNSYVKKCIDVCNSEKEAAEIFAEHWTCTESYIKLRGSAIYREKGKVSARLQARFVGGKRYAFEQSFFTVFDFPKNARIAVATEGEWAQIRLISWRTEEEKYYMPD